MLKKLLERFGGEHRREPGAFRYGDKIFIHLIVYEKLKRLTTEKLLQEVF